MGESASFDVLIGGEKCLIVSLGEKRFLLKLENAKIYSEAHSPQGENFHIAKFPEQNATMRQTLKDATKYYRLTFVEKQPTLIMETDTYIRHKDVTEYYICQTATYLMIEISDFKYICQTKPYDRDIGEFRPPAIELLHVVHVAHLKKFKFDK